jgi:hypothetical protein
MEAICPSEMSVGFQRTTRCYISEDRSLHKPLWENFKSLISFSARRPAFLNDIISDFPQAKDKFVF